MFEKTNTIILSGEEFPLKCDLVVLELAQEKYGSLSKFEDGLYHFVPELDGEGNPVQNAQGLYVGNVLEPNLGTLGDALSWMVEEGCMIEGVETIPSRIELLRKADKAPRELAEELHEELKRCFERKNKKPMQNQARKK